MQNSQDPGLHPVVRVAIAIAVWIGSCTLADVQRLVSIASGLAVGGYAAYQWYVLWLNRNRPECALNPSTRRRR